MSTKTLEINWNVRWRLERALFSIGRAPSPTWAKVFAPSRLLSSGPRPSSSQSSMEDSDPRERERERHSRDARRMKRHALWFDFCLAVKGHFFTRQSSCPPRGHLILSLSLSLRTNKHRVSKALNWGPRAGFSLTRPTARICRRVSWSGPCFHGPHHGGP